jgi:hypothetical protein
MGYHLFYVQLRSILGHGIITDKLYSEEFSQSIFYTNVDSTKIMLKTTESNHVTVSIHNVGKYLVSSFIKTWENM